MEVVERVRAGRGRLSRNGARWITSGVQEALDGDAIGDGICEVPAVGESVREVDEFGGWQAGLEVGHGVAAGFVGVGPQDDRGGAIQERFDGGTLDALAAALPGDDDVGRE